MFTGLIRTTATLRLLGHNLAQVICTEPSPEAILEGLELGDSVAVDGICLTVTEIQAKGFVAAVSPETLSRTTLNSDSGEVYVNLEPSLKVGSKLGGHFVTGHIDGGYLEASVQTEDSWEMSFQVTDARVARYIVSKGSIAVNGVSLTIAACNAVGSWFKVAVIPLTYAETNLRYLQPGSPVNLEGDVLGKYVEKFLRLDRSTAEPGASLQEMSGVTDGFLAEHGYF
jgi:riboflavin synthase